MLRTDIRREVYRYHDDEYWGAPENTRQKAINFLTNLTDKSLSLIDEGEVRPTTNYCMDITLTHHNDDLMVLLGDTEDALLLWCNGSRVIDDTSPKNNFTMPMGKLAHLVNTLVNKYFNN